MTLETIDSFPPDLRFGSREDRLRYFAQVIILHPCLVHVLQTVLTVIAQSNAPFIVRVYGAPGVGKSLLLSLIEQALIEQWLAQTEHNPGHVPLVSLLARSPELGQFDLDHYFKQVLTTLHEPLIDYKIEPGIGTSKRRVTSSALQHSATQALKHRQPMVVLIDDGQHLLKASSTQYREAVAESIYTTANATRVRHILLGTFDMLDFPNENAESATSSEHIQFRRYRLDADDDVEIFLRLLLTFQRHLPLQKEPDLVGLYKHLNAGCLGCVGLLKSWLYRTLAAALARHQSTITLELLQEHAETPYTLARLSQEIVEGERRLSMLEDQTKQNKEPPAAPRSAPPKPKQQPGKRTPIRDKVRA